MTLRRVAGIFIVLFSIALSHLRAQQAVSPVEHARLAQENSIPVKPTTVNTGGAAIGNDEEASDDGLGEQVILKQTSPAPFFVTGDAGFYYTNNAALTPNNEIADSFVVVDAGLGWASKISPDLAAQVAAHSSLFRYDTTSRLDFTSVGVGAGLSWRPQQLENLDFFARYDFIKMFDRHSDEILSDHQFTVGGERTFSPNPFQTLVIGTVLTAGLTEPESAQRDQAGFFLTYRFQPTPSIGFDLTYRFAGQFYNDTGRIDRNQVGSAAMHYWFSRSVNVNALFSLTHNNSSDSAFDYSALSVGGGLSLSVQF